MIQFITNDEESPAKEPEVALGGRRGLGRADIRSKPQERRVGRRRETAAVGRLDKVRLAQYPEDY